MNLVIDVGNTLIKAGIFEGKKLICLETTTKLDKSFVEFLLRQYPSIEKGIFSIVGKVEPEIIQFLTEEKNFLEFSGSTPVPVINLYRTPKTLGSDRLAAVVSAHLLYPEDALLVIDAGTCITYDFLTSANEYIGGGISPGIKLRFKSLNDYTSKLPLLEPAEIDYLAGKTTHESIMSGVMNGIICEIKGLIDWYSRQYESHKVVMTGGDLLFFEKPLKSIIFAVPNLVLLGLNEILEYNSCQ